MNWFKHLSTHLDSPEEAEVEDGEEGEGDEDHGDKLVAQAGLESKQAPMVVFASSLRTIEGRRSTEMGRPAGGRNE